MRKMVQPLVSMRSHCTFRPGEPDGIRVSGLKGPQGGQCFTLQVRDQRNATEAYRSMNWGPLQLIQVGALGYLFPTPPQTPV